MQIHWSTWSEVWYFKFFYIFPWTKKDFYHIFPLPLQYIFSCEATQETAHVRASVHPSVCPAQLAISALNFSEYAKIHICSNTCLHTFTPMFTPMFTHIYTHVYTHIYTYLDTCYCSYVHIFKNMVEHVHTYVQTHVYTFDLNNVYIFVQTHV